MNLRIPPCYRKFRFDLTVEINSGVAMSGGELAEAISDGLMVLEERRLLFPGVRPTDGGNWLVGISMQCTGYDRPARLPGVGAAYTHLMEPEWRRQHEKEGPVSEQLRDMADDVGVAILKLRALQARLSGMAEIVGSRQQGSPDATSAAAIAEAAAVILAAIDSQMRSSE